MIFRFSLHCLLKYDKISNQVKQKMAEGHRLSGSSAFRKNSGSRRIIREDEKDEDYLQQHPRR